MRSAAPNIVSTSFFQLLTIHSDGLLRLWNLDDGRCVISSHKSLFPSKPKAMTSLGDEYPGFVAVVGSESEIFIVDVYTMSLISQ